MAEATGELLRIGGVDVHPGTRRELEIPVARLPTGTWVALPVAVLHGARPGPRLWLSAAIHGDELNGIEIIRQLLPRLRPAELSGSVIAVPIVNVFGFLGQDRYLPDRRDLNRCFPGSPKGSLAARLAHLFMREIASLCQYGIDFHTGSHYRSNLPQLRADLIDVETRRCAQAFGAPIAIHARSRDGSLREAATRRGSHVLVYEGGEALRFDVEAIRVGVHGVLRVIDVLGMRRARERRGVVFHESRRTRWLRARRGGILFLRTALGEWVERGQALGTISDTFSAKSVEVRAPVAGLVISVSTLPLVNRGDAIVHLAEPEQPRGR